MGAVWLGSMPQVLRDAGLNVRTWPGWETRSRSSGGYDEVLAIGLHHDAIRAGTSTDARCLASWENAQYRPVGAIVLGRDGEVVVGAAGATNTQGKGGPYPCSKGTIPLDSGNRYMLSIEAANDGVGEPWPQAQIDAYVKLCAALCDWLGLDPARDCLAHFEWTDPGESILSGSKRKIDPAGPSKYAVPNAVYQNMWDMPLFRSDVVSSGTPTPTPPEEEDMQIRFTTSNRNGQFLIGSGMPLFLSEDMVDEQFHKVPRVKGVGPDEDARWDEYKAIWDAAQVIP